MSMSMSMSGHRRAMSAKLVDVANDFEIDRHCMKASFLS